METGNVSYTQKIDWLTVTVDELQNARFILDGYEEKRAAPAKPRAFYTDATYCEFGTIFTNDREERQRPMIIVTGDNWSALAVAGINPQQFLSDILALPHCHVTRLDFALDIIGGDEDLTELMTEWKAQRIQCSARKAQRVGGYTNDGKDLGQTVYFGSRQSERMVRVYDKAAQLQEKVHHTRIEMEMKGRAASAAARHMTKNDIGITGKSCINAFMQTRLEWWKEALDVRKNCEYIKLDKKPETDHEKWLRDVACPAVIAAIESDIDFVYDAIWQAVLARAKRMTGS